MQSNSIFILVVSCLLISATDVFPGWARLYESHAGRCSLIDSRSPTQFITYEHNEERPNGSTENVLLRLQNNTNCPIIIPTGGMRITKLPEGGSTTDIQDGAKMDIYYEIVPRSKPPQAGRYGLGDEIIVSRLPGGKSVVFDVSSKFTKGKVKLRVPFKYEGEEGPAPGTGSNTHYVVFNLSSALKKVPEKK